MRTRESKVESPSRRAATLAMVNKAVTPVRRLGNQEMQQLLAARPANSISSLPYREVIERSFGPGHDLSNVRCEIGGAAALKNALVGSSAFTRGEQISFRAEPTLDEAAHEAAHVVQQRQGSIPPGGFSRRGDRWEQHADKVAGRVTGGEPASDLVGAAAPPVASANPAIQRRLIAHGSDVDFADFQALVEPATGLMLIRDPVTDEVRSIGSTFLPPTSPYFSSMLTNIMDDPIQDAELQLGTHQSATGAAGGPGAVLVGAFPYGTDFTQTIDLDDLQNVEAGAPGRGVAFLAHEIMENYVAHTLPAGGASLGAAHDVGNIAEENVSQDLFGPGDELLEYIAPNPPRGASFIEDYEDYFVVMDFESVKPPAGTSAPPDAIVTGARQVTPTVIATFTIDNFATGSDVMPGAGVASLTTAAALLTAHPTAALHIDGFTDDVGNPGNNLDLAQRRADNGKTIIGAALARRVAAIGRGETSFVAPNTNESNRARNRRIVLTVLAP
jgi:outer membrane protein OmpA-like peptidoglycan-associated protein